MQQLQGDAATHTAAAATSPTITAPGTDSQSAGTATAAAEQINPSSTAPADVVGPSGSAGPSAPAKPVTATPALTAAAGAADDNTSGKSTPSRSARRKAAKRLLIRTGVLPHKRECTLAKCGLLSDQQEGILRCLVDALVSPCACIPASHECFPCSLNAFKVKSCKITRAEGDRKRAQITEPSETDTFGSV